MNTLNTKANKVQKMNNAPKPTLQVLAGDTIEISAKAFYNMDNAMPGRSVDVAPVIGAAVAAMTNPVNNVLSEAAQLAENPGAAATNWVGLAELPQKNHQPKEVQPKSGINFVLYNNLFEVVEENTGYLPVDDRINAIQTLATDRMIMKEAGFLEIFVNNEAQTPVYYDNMMVVHNNSNSNVLEVNAYYPFGMLMPGLSLLAPPGKFNAYKHSAKELQKEFEINLYDHGARMFSPVLGGRWITPDPMAEKGYHLSPYSYAFNNPVNFIDPDGRWASPYFDEFGNYLGVDEQGYKGNIYVTTKDAFDRHSSNGVAKSKDIQADSHTKSIDKVILTSEAQSNIYTHAMLRTEGVDFSKLYNNKVSVLEKSLWNGKEIVTKGFNDPDNYDRFGFSETRDGAFKVTARSGSNQNELTTVEIIQNSLGVHEYDGHGNKGFSGGNRLGGTHWQAYQLQVKHPTFQFLPKWRQEEILLRVREFLYHENPSLFQRHFGSK